MSIVGYKTCGFAYLGKSPGHINDLELRAPLSLVADLDLLADHIITWFVESLRGTAKKCQ